MCVYAGACVCLCKSRAPKVYKTRVSSTYSDESISESKCCVANPKGETLSVIPRKDFGRIIFFCLVIAIYLENYRWRRHNTMLETEMLALNWTRTAVVVTPPAHLSVLQNTHYARPVMSCSGSALCSHHRTFFNKNVERKGHFF